MEALAEREREKYEKVWTFDAYRRTAPGELVATKALMLLEADPGESIIDYGCGTGRAAKIFHDFGLDVTGVDIAENCLDPDIDIPFVSACLWDLPPLESDYAFCTDVMEHLPEQHVADVLNAIRERTRGRVFFQIFTADDAWKHRVGEQLHLTVKPSQWWASKIRDFWPSVDCQGDSRNRVEFLCS